MTVIDGATNGVIVTVAVGDGPDALCYDPTNDKVYCANGGNYSPYDSTVTVIDGGSDSVIATVGVGIGPSAFAWNPVQNRVYVANYRNSSISVLRDSDEVGTQENAKPQAARSKLLPTIVRGVLVLGAAGSRQQSVDRGDLLNSVGRRVAELHAGANDVSRLAPGVYFVRERLAVGGRPSAVTVRKVVIQR